MDSNLVKHIVERSRIPSLIIYVSVTKLPLWFVEVIVLLSEQYTEQEIKIVYLNGLNQKNKWQKWYTPILVAEKIVFRQNLNAFKTIDIHHAFEHCKNVETCQSLSKLYIQEGVCLSFMDEAGAFCGVNYYRYPQEILSVGFRGVDSFVKNYLFGQKPLKVFKEDALCWQHLFQTLEYGIDKNSGFLQAAVKQSIISLWRSKKTCDKRLSSETVRIGDFEFCYKWFKSAIVRVIKRFKKILFYKRWFIILKKENDRKLLLPGGKDGWADPFVVDGKYLFVEQIDFKSNKGKLVVTELDDNSDIVKYETIIDEPFHLSYPNVFKKDDLWYMLPESAADKSLRLYVSSNFPTEWSFKRKLKADIRFLDFTPLYHNGFWWLFTTSKVMERGSSYDQLYLFYSEDFINDEWQPHPQNPVITDSSVARPAGNLYWHNNELYRPSQDCFNKYGGSIKVNRVVKLSKEEYKEELVEEISSQTLGVKAHAVHTINIGAGITVYDAQTWAFRL
ncbi:glucosamine inositolphosphorylceramide transferase family protein [Carboxylicivirga marina]|uniref:Glucosamine inositolphosphorylceramide transferase 1 N-terminal domain-containing protein n=1 Tax=Carboxylicivirga marina TaxID=2800988 RepID=A0ABS1HQI3_9BACT|nr:hypothetical protein [Carboxylicivirga marina]MBK3519938.1 hypothetical protein [Carboxylicivirga marina]